ncbi:MAG: AAA family ATPase [Nanoarchaeota archaeon]
MLYDAFPNIKFIISSSGSIALEEEAIKNLSGRYFLINVKPLNFREFLELRGKNSFLEKPELWENEIKKELSHYIKRSFPEIINWEDEILIRDYLRTTIIDKIVKQDLPEKFKNVNRDLLLSLIEIFYTEPGMFLDYDGMSKKLRISKKTLIRNILYLEFSYLIRRVRNFRPNILSSSKKLQRVYANWWGLVYCYYNNPDKIMENLVGSYIDAKYYWRENSKEIDFLNIKDKTIVPFEVKNKEIVFRNELKNIEYFINKYKIKKGIIIYNGDEDKINQIRLCPLWKFLLEY